MEGVMGNRKYVVYVAIIFLLAFTVAGLMRFGYVVFDRQVFDFQINPIIESGKVTNLREYTIVHEYIEMNFESDPDKFSNNPLMEQLDAMLGTYEKNYP
jgi:uncharacterized membrane protein